MIDPATLPPGFDHGDFSDELRALIIALKYCGNMSEPKIGNNVGFTMVGIMKSYRLWCRVMRSCWMVFKRDTGLTTKPCKITARDQRERKKKSCEPISMKYSRRELAMICSMIALRKRNAKRKFLLTVLKHPAVPLHNNDSELGARVSARRRDVSLHSRSVRGVRAMDIFTTLVQTAKKLGISAYAYIRDRLCGKISSSTLSEIILSTASV